MGAKENNRTLLDGRAQVLGPAGAAAAAAAVVVEAWYGVYNIIIHPSGLGSVSSSALSQLPVVVQQKTFLLCPPRPHRDDDDDDSFFFYYFIFFSSTKPALGPVLFFSRTIQIPISIKTTPTTGKKRKPYCFATRLLLFF